MRLNSVLGPTEFLITIAALYPNNPALVNNVRRAARRPNTPNIPAMRAAVLKLMSANHNLNKTTALLKAWRRFEAGAQAARRVTGEKRKRQNTSTNRPASRKLSLTNLPEHVVLEHIASKLNTRNKAKFAIAVPHFEELRNKNFKLRSAGWQELRDMAYVAARIIRGLGVAGSVYGRRRPKRSAQELVRRELPMARRLAAKYGFTVTPNPDSGEMRLVGKLVELYVDLFWTSFKMYDEDGSVHIHAYVGHALTGTRGQVVWRILGGQVGIPRAVPEAMREGIADAYRIPTSSIRYVPARKNNSNSNSNNNN